MNPTLKGLDQWPNVAREEKDQPNPDWIPSEAPVVVFGNVMSAPLNLGPKSEPLPETFVQAVSKTAANAEGMKILIGSDKTDAVAGFFEAIKPEVLKKEGDEAFERFWDHQKKLHKGRSLPACGSVAKWLFISGYDEGRCR